MSSEQRGKKIKIKKNAERQGGSLRKESHIVHTAGQLLCDVGLLARLDSLIPHEARCV